MNEFELEEIKEKVNKSNKYLLYVELSDIKKLIKYIDHLETQINLRIEEVHNLYKTISRRDNRISELYEKTISKDKIRKKIEELKQYKEEIKEEKDFEYFNALRIIRVLKALIGE